jgi:ankyrin repeat protein
MEDVRCLIASGADLHHRDRDGFTPLMRAANHGDAALARVLVELGANVNEESTVRSLGGRSISAFTPLMAACCDSARDTQTVRTLLELGARPEARDSLGRTARDYAEIQGYGDLKKLLEEVGAPQIAPG